MKTKYWKVRFAQVEEQAGLPLTAIWNFSLPVFVGDYSNSLQTHSKQLLLFSLPPPLVQIWTWLHTKYFWGILVFRISYFLSSISLPRWFIILVHFKHAIKAISAQGGWTHLARIIKVPIKVGNEATWFSKRFIYEPRKKCFTKLKVVFITIH